MAALVVDVGSLYQKRASFQTVADSAALAGAQELPENPGNSAINRAIEYAGKYNVTIMPEDVVISATLAPNDTITVTPSDPAPVYFAGVLGINTVDVGASAKAMVGEPEQVYYVVPWAAIVPPGTTKWWDVLVPGVDRTIATYPDTVSNFCAWNEVASLPPGWDAIYGSRIINGCSFPLSIGDTIYVLEIRMAPPKHTVDPTGTRIGGWANPDPFGSLVTIEGGLIKLAKSSDTQLVIVPVIEGPKALGAQATILAFAPFIILGKTGSGNNTRIIGKFIDQALIVYEGEVKGVELKGLRVIRLIR